MQSNTAKREFEREALPLSSELLNQALVYTKNPDEAADLVQETYLKAFAAWHTFEMGTSCRNWMHRILRNSFLSRCRKKTREKRWLSDRRGVVESMHAGGSRRSHATPEVATAERRLEKQARLALAELAPEFKRVLELHCIAGKTYAEIAQMLGCPVGTVMSRVHRARNHLRRNLARRIQAKSPRAPQGPTPAPAVARYLMAA
jgi:RNA polymerase sigma-70 factor (ECF subfamily)